MIIFKTGFLNFKYLMEVLWTYNSVHRNVLNYTAVLPRSYLINLNGHEYVTPVHENKMIGFAECLKRSFMLTGREANIL
jgi:hypothetical protein